MEERELAIPVRPELNKEQGSQKGRGKRGKSWENGERAVIK